MHLSARTRLILACAVLAAQAIILALSLFAPRVSPEYRAFFIEHTATVWHGDGG